MIWIDGGLHATEVLGAQQLIETIYQFASKNDEETLRILRDVIILATHANPDGMELVSDWYMRKPNEKQRSTGALPRLYQKYVGHDNNRDFYMMNQPESTNMNRILYREWFPQIMYNHHQTGPTGTVMFSPPFRDPFNYVYDPLVVNTLDQVGAAMHTRFDAEGKPGVTTRSGANYSTWWNGGLRTMAYFHNQVGLLTEIDRQPDAGDDRLRARSRHRRAATCPSRSRRRCGTSASRSTTRSPPITRCSTSRSAIARPALQHLRDGPKQHQARQRRQLDDLSAPHRGSEGRDRKGHEGRRQRRIRACVRGGRIATVPDKYYDDRCKQARMARSARLHPLRRSRRLPDRDQVRQHPDQGRRHRRIARPRRSRWRASSIPPARTSCKGAQAFRPHVLDMFEPQDHPNDFQYPGGPPIPPYDSAGWTLAFQMGLKFDRMLDAFEVPTEKVPDVIKPAPGKVTEAAGAVGYVVNHKINDAFIAVNRLLKAGEEVFFVGDRTLSEHRRHRRDLHHRQAVDAGDSRQGGARSRSQLHGGDHASGGRDAIGCQAVASACGISTAARCRPDTCAGCSSSSSSPSSVVFPATLDAGNLKAKFDVLLFPDGGIPETRRRRWWRRFRRRQPTAAEIPAEYRAHLGRVTLKQTMPQLKAFAEDGGAIVAFGGSAVLGHHLGLPVSDHLVEVAAGRQRAAAARHEVLHSRRRAAGRGRQHQSDGFRLREEGGRVLRQQPGDGAGAGCGDARRQDRGVVRQQGAAALRLGVGPALSRRRHGAASKRRSARARCSCSDRRSPSARSRTARSSSCSTASFTAPRSR